jgi:hypothetical protein
MNLGPETGYHDSDFRDFPQNLQTNAGIVSQIRPRPLPFTFFLIN